MTYNLTLGLTCNVGRLRVTSVIGAKQKRGKKDNKKEYVSDYFNLFLSKVAKIPRLNILVIH